MTESTKSPNDEQPLPKAYPEDTQATEFKQLGSAEEYLDEEEEMDTWGDVDFEDAPELVSFYEKLDRTFATRDEFGANNIETYGNITELSAFVEESLEGYQQLTPQESWQAATHFLGKLQTVDDESMRQLFETRVCDKLISSLEGSSPLEGNVYSYIAALHATTKSRSSLSDASSRAGRLITLHHSDIKGLVDRHTQDPYLEMVRDPAVFEMLGNFFMTSGEEHVDFDRYDENSELLSDILNGIGIRDTKGCIAAWTGTVGTNSDGAEKFRIETTQNLHRLAELMRADPEAPRLLHEFYGIRGFYRYSKRMLAQQFEQHGKKDRPYGIYINALEDHNNSATFGHGLSASAEIESGTHQTHYTRIVETATGAELDSRLATLTDMYGPRSISFALLKAHSTAESVVLSTGPNPESQELHLGSKLDHLAQCFAPDAVMVMASCSAGRKAGIAEKLSRDWGIIVVAPEDTAGLTGLAVRIEGEVLRIVPSYSSDSPSLGALGEEVAAALYIAGEKIAVDDPLYKGYFGLAT